jgi:hypothetical protein
MAFNTDNQCFPSALNHLFLPRFFAIFDVREFSNVVDFEVALFFAAILALVG